MHIQHDTALLSEAQAAQYIGMSCSFLRQARATGTRPNRTPAPRFIKINRTVRYPLDELIEWLKQFPRKEHLFDDPSQ